MEWEALLDVVRQMAETRTLAPLLTYATEQALHVIGADRGFLILLNPDGSLDFRVQFTRSGEVLPNPHEEVSLSIVLRVVQTGEPLISSDAGSDVRLKQAASVHGLRIRAIMCVPLIARGSVLGALYIENRTGLRVFTDEDLRRMRYYASQAAVSIQNAMLNEELEQMVAARTANLAEANAQLQAQIAERTRIEKQLRESEERLALALAGSAYALWDWNLETGEVIRDARWATMLGYQPHEIAPHMDAWQQVCHPDDVDRVQQLYNDHLEGRAPVYEAEYRLRAANGTWKWIHDRGRVVERDAQGTPLRMTGTQHDITARKQAEQALRLAHDRLSVLQQVDLDLARQLNVDYVLDIALEAAVRLSGAQAGTIGLAEAEIVRLVRALGGYKPLIGTRLPLDVGITARVMREHEAVLVTDVSTDPDYVSSIPSTRAQMTLPLMSGERFVGVLNLETDEPERFGCDTFDFVKLLAARIGVALDNARTYEELERLVSDLDAFADMVAHDLKNPLSLVMGYISLLQSAEPGEFSSAEIKTYLGAVQSHAQTMVGIIDSLLLLAGVRRTPVLLDALKMGAVVDNVIAQLSALIKRSGARIERQQEWPAAIGYQPWIERVWVNYVSNALKYGGQPPVVRLGADPQPDGFVRFWVADNGLGLTPQQQERVFEPFTRVTDRNVEGHGLGLTIVQRIVTRLGGVVGVESTAEGGTIFSFTLPSAVD